MNASIHLHPTATTRIETRDSLHGNVVLALNEPTGNDLYLYLSPADARRMIAVLEDALAPVIEQVAA